MKTTRLLAISVFFTVYICDTTAFRYFYFLPETYDDNLEAQESFQRNARSSASEGVRHIMHTVLFDPHMRRTIRNINGKRGEFERTGGPILLG